MLVLLLLTAHFVLCVLQVERAMRAHSMGVFNPPGDFDQKTHWNPIRAFYTKISGVGEIHWVRALTFEDCVTGFGVDESLLSAYRDDFFIPSS